MEGPHSFGLITLDEAVLVAGLVFSATVVGGLAYSWLFGQWGARKRELDALRVESMRQLDAVNREAFLERERLLALKRARRRRAKRLKEAALKQEAERKQLGEFGAAS